MTDEFEDLGYARADTGRERRLGLPEVVYGPGKTPEQIIGVVRSLLAANTGPVLVTRLSDEVAAAVGAAVPGGGHDPAARLLMWRPPPPGAVRGGGGSPRPARAPGAGPGAPRARGPGPG